MSRLDPALFIGETPVSKTVKLADGSEHTFYFRELLASRLGRYHDELASPDVKVAQMAQASLLADGVCTAEGEVAMSPEEAYRLKPLVQLRFRQALFEVNGLSNAAKNG